MVPVTLDEAIADVLGRLGDLANETWSSDEIKLYLRDGYDQFCAKTKCLWDVHVIENIPITGNWQTDLERSIAEKTPGFGDLTDRPFHFTGEHERNLSTISSGYGQSYSGPAPATVPGTTWTNPDTGAALPSVVPGGDLPHSTVGVSRVYYDNRTLQGTSSTHLKSLDPNYEKRTGDPQWFTWDKDGIFFLRVVPAATGNAAYDTVSGSWGVLTQRLDSAGDVADTIITETDETVTNVNTATSYWGFEEAAGGPYVDTNTAKSLTQIGTFSKVSGKSGEAIFTTSASNGNRLELTGANIVPASGNWTISFWHKKDNTNPAIAFGMLLYDGDPDSESPAFNYADMRFRINWPQHNSPLAPAFQVSNGTALTTISGFSNISNDVWYLVTIAYDGTKCYMTVYDGASYDETFSATVTPNATPTAIAGLHGLVTAARCNGTTDSLTVWNEYVTQANVRLSVTPPKVWGLLKFRDDTFPSSGQYGTPTRIHPETDNIMVEVYRLGRDLATHPFELPSAYLKYVYFWAMAQAFERDGPGQDLELSALYYDRFALGVSRMERKKRDMDVERVGAFGGPGIEDADFALGDATAPFPYGIPF